LAQCAEKTPTVNLLGLVSRISNFTCHANAGVLLHFIETPTAAPMGIRSIFHENPRMLIFLAWLQVSAVCADGLLDGMSGIAFDPSQGVDSQFSYEPDNSGAPIGDFTSSVGGNSFNGNNFLGANRYYNHSTSITGQNTITTNLEAGHIWNGHESLGHVTSFTHSSDTWGGASVAPKYDRHATWVGMLIGGRQTNTNGGIFQQGIAYGTDLRSAAIATSWSGAAYAGAFSNSANSYVTAFANSFGTADVINSSFGYTDPGGTDVFTLFSDSMAYQNPFSTYVTSAGNSGSAANTVGAPGAGYNTITVGALGNANTYDAAASFSSRSPQSFGYYNKNGAEVIVNGVRAAVDISAPGASLNSAFYGGQNGGNNTTLAGSTNNTATNQYSQGIAGTSFSAPLVAGGASLVASAAKTLAGLSSNQNARQSVVVKALLLNGADKTSGWSNGQVLASAGGDSYISTTQSVDWVVGTGRMNLDTTFQLQVNGQIDVTGTGQGQLGSVATSGWDYGNAMVGTNNDYVLANPILGNSTITTTLTWMRVREWDAVTGDLYEIAQANLNLSVWSLDQNNTFTDLVARSESFYNNVEHLTFTVPTTGRYGIRVEYGGNTFDNTTNNIWGTNSYLQDYGLSWNAVAVPEPGSLMLVSLCGPLLIFSRGRALAAMRKKP
jgi:hypothetical protein